MAIRLEMEGEREEVSASDPRSPSEMTGVCRGRGCEGEGGDKRGEGGGKHTHRMISGGSCCQDLLDNLPLYWGSGETLEPCTLPLSSRSIDRPFAGRNSFT